MKARLKRHIAQNPTAAELVEQLEARAAKLEQTIRDADTELAALPERLAEAKRMLAAENARAGQINFAELRAELGELTAAMNRDGATTVRKQRLHQILSAARLARACGHSYEMQRLMIERIEQGRERKLSWSVFDGWVRQRQEAA
jgi:hypothetical protein